MKTTMSIEVLRDRLDNHLAQITALEEHLLEEQAALHEMVRQAYANGFSVDEVFKQ